MNFQPPEEDDPRDDDQRQQAATKPGEADLTDAQIDDALEAWFANSPAGADQETDRASMRAAIRAALGTAPATPVPDAAFSEASSLATALFKKHFAHEPDYASGKVVWGLCDTTAGILTQIDNMVSGLVQPVPASDPVARTREEARKLVNRYTNAFLGWYERNDPEAEYAKAARELLDALAAPTSPAPAPATPVPEPRSTGHGHVFPRPDGLLARCGGPRLCLFCKGEASRL